MSTAISEDLRQRIAQGMRQGIQNNFQNENVRKWGCFFLTLMKVAEIKAGMHFRNDDIIEAIYHECVRRGYMDANCFIRNAVAVMNYAVSKNLFKSSDRVKSPPMDDICMMQLQKPTTTHFVVCDGFGNIIWDSWNPSSAGMNYPVIDYRTLVLN